MNKQTKSTKISEIQRHWHLLDVKEKILGRSASDIALLLAGKSKPNFVRNLDCGDFVVVINAATIRVTGNKENDKKYYSHSGYPGGLKIKTVKEIRVDNPTEILRHAVAGMLPQNRLKPKMLKRLYVFPEGTHTYKDKFIK
jgi:large subunit ribosomal protein L13